MAFQWQLLYNKVDCVIPHSSGDSWLAVMIVDVIDWWVRKYCVNFKPSFCLKCEKLTCFLQLNLVRYLISSPKCHFYLTIYENRTYLVLFWIVVFTFFLQKVLDDVVTATENVSISSMAKLYSVLSMCIYQQRENPDKTTLVEVIFLSYITFYHMLLCVCVYAMHMYLLTIIYHSLLLSCPCYKTFISG